MLSFTGAIKVFVALEPQDMRKSFNGLSAAVSEHLQCDPYQGALYLFTNRRHDRLKILFWDGTGLWVASKRLEQGTFSWPKPSQKGQKRLSLTPEALSLLTDGVDLKGARMRPWYERE
jgi:transposase